MAKTPEPAAGRGDTWTTVAFSSRRLGPAGSGAAEAAVSAAARRSGPSMAFESHPPVEGAMNGRPVKPWFSGTLYPAKLFYIQDKAPLVPRMLRLQRPTAMSLRKLIISLAAPAAFLTLSGCMTGLPTQV